MKKLIVAFLIFSLMLVSAVAAYASDVTIDIKNENVKKAVVRLSGLNIVQGKEDGKYHPEGKVTREEFATLAVKTLGLGASIAPAQGITKFSDVEENRWSSGAINVSSQQQLIKGYKDGTFKPTGNVNYAEVVTVLMRMLGYKDELLPGTWPGNYMAKAGALGILNNLNVNATDSVDRGSIAIMISNALDVKMVNIENKTLLDNLNEQLSKTK